MDWIQGLQKAIDYTEAHLTEDLDYEKIAAHAFSSSFHFQRVFSLLTGITLGEYIRCRRLTMAGEELSLSKGKVIDLAMKYGYDSPESFTKAFARFHGISPSAARAPGAKLRSFSRLSIKLILEGGTIMNYRIENKNSLKVLARVEAFDLEDSNTKIPQFWSKVKKDGSMNTLCASIESGRPSAGISGVLGICDGDTGAKTFRYAIGVETKLDKAPQGFEIMEIPAATWAVFPCVGSMPGAIQEQWKRIFSEFLPQSDYQPTHGSDFELYPDGDISSPDYQSEIWFPVEKKK